MAENERMPRPRKNKNVLVIFTVLSFGSNTSYAMAGWGLGVMVTYLGHWFSRCCLRVNRGARFAVTALKKLNQIGVGL